MSKRFMGPILTHSVFHTFARPANLHTHSLHPSLLSGSLYVDTLVDQLKQYGSKESIENVLRRVHYNVNTVSLLENVPGQGEVPWKQAPYFESSLQKAFIFPKTDKQ